MKAILEFDLPEERAEHHYALKGADAFAMLRGFDEHLRQQIKYQTDLPEAFRNGLQSARDALHKKLAERGMDLYGED